MYYRGDPRDRKGTGPFWARFRLNLLSRHPESRDRDGRMNPSRGRNPRENVRLYPFFNSYRGKGS